MDATKLSPGQALSSVHNNVCLLETISSGSALSGLHFLDMGIRIIRKQSEMILFI